MIAVARAASVRAFSSAARARLRCTVMSTAAVETRTNAPARRRRPRGGAARAAELIDGAGRAGQDGLVAQVPLDVFGQGQRALVAPGRVLLQRLHDDGLQVARDGAAGDASVRARPLAQGHRRLVADHAKGFELRPVGHVVRQRARDQLVEDHAEGIHVRAEVDLVGVAARLLRAHVGQRSLHSAGLGEQRGDDVGVGDPGQAEVEDLDLQRTASAAGALGSQPDQDVGGLEVAVHDPALMRVVDGLADLHEQVQP